jgi:hypothetical protein
VACAPQSVTREIQLTDGGPGLDGAPAPVRLDGPLRPAGVIDAGPADAPPPPRDTAARAADTAARPADTSVLIDPPATLSPDAAAEAPGRPIALLVVGSTMPLGNDDDKLRQRLENNGLTVRLALDTGAPAAADGASLVVISGSSLGSNVGNKYTGLAIPVLCLEPAILAAMRLTGAGDAAQGNATGTQITITASEHPVAGGLTGTVDVTQGPVNFGWGLPGESATRIATLAGMANRYAVFAYEKGAMLVGMPPLPAPARRVVLFIHTLVADRLTPAGWKVFDAAVGWSLGR